MRYYNKLRINSETGQWERYKYETMEWVPYKKRNEKRDKIIFLLLLMWLLAFIQSGSFIVSIISMVVLFFLFFGVLYLIDNLRKL